MAHSIGSKWPQSGVNNADLLEGLFGDFEDRHTIAVIEKVVSQSRAQLAWQSSRAAQLELLDRLARQRSEDLPPTRSAR